MSLQYFNLWQLWLSSMYLVLKRWFFLGRNSSASVAPKLNVSHFKTSAFKMWTNLNLREKVDNPNDQMLLKKQATTLTGESLKVPAEKWKVWDESVWSVDISNKLWGVQLGFSRRSTVNFHRVPPLRRSRWSMYRSVVFFVLFFKVYYDKMLLLLIIILTKAPNNSSVRTVSQQKGLGTVTYRLNTEILLHPLTAWTFLVLNSARPAHKATSKQTLQRMFQSC